jgi:hypothetical protein
MAMCKADLVAGVLKELGQEVPDPETLSRAVFEASAELKRQNGIEVSDCLLMAPVNARWYEGGVRAEAIERERRESIHI